MEEQLVRLLDETQSAQESIRKNAEWQLKQQSANPDFPLGLLAVASHNDVPLPVRQAALLYLKTFTLACWSDGFEEFRGPLYTDENKKAQIRQQLLELALGGNIDRKLESAASLVVSTIATVDFPDSWPDLLPQLLNVVANGSDERLHGALKVLNELVDDCFNDSQFFSVARNLIQVIYNVAANPERKIILRALAVSVFRSCFDTLEMIMEDHKAAVKAFAEETVAGWIPFLLETLKSPLPPAPSPEADSSTNDDAQKYRGSVALKLQGVKVLMRIRTLFPSTLGPHSPALFSATWHELSTLQAQYQEMYIDNDHQGRLEDSDGLPYTLDFLVLEELDFLQACLRAPPVRKELESQISAAGGPSWMEDVLKIAVAYAQITEEEEGLWDFDVNVFLSEEVNVTANYTPRSACGDLIIKLGEWLSNATVDGLLAYTRTLYAQNASWKAKEASLYLLNQVLGEFQDVFKPVDPESANGYVDFIRHAMQEESVFLRARGYLVAGSLTRTSGAALQQVSSSLLDASLEAVNSDESDIVKVSCIRALQHYLQALPPSVTQPRQTSVVNSLNNFIQTQDMDDLTESDDLLITVIETLRDTILLDARSGLEGGGLDLLFSVGSKGASNFQIAMLVTETFQEVVERLNSARDDSFAMLAGKVLPTLMGAFDVATLTEADELANLSADLLSVLAEYGTSPLPQGFVVTVMPRLTRLLLVSQDDELLKSATAAVKNMLAHDPAQVFSYQDHEGKGGLEVVLVIIDRLLNPSMDDNSASEVGGLAAEVVENAGSEKLGPYLPQLLQAVAVRLASASQAQFIQSLILVFARLSLISAQDVVGFLADTRIGDQSGLQVVITKWLENSINFAGYEDIRQNVVALSKLYSLNDQRLAAIQVKGDLIVQQQSSSEPRRIVTRSRARQNPDQYTTISAQFKILKVLVEELLSASDPQPGVQRVNSAAPGEAVVDDDDDDDEDGDWEDEGDFLDLGSGMTKAQLMAYANDDAPTFARGRDDETQAFLVNFFREQATQPGFVEVFNALSPAEQDKLRSIG